MLQIRKINDEFSSAIYGDFEIIIRNDNGYINATKLCKMVGKEFFHWKANSVSKELIKELSNHLNISENKLIESPNVDNNLRGSYVHPLLITHIACWCGPNFAIKVGIWIEEWKQHSVINELKYWDGIKNIKPSKKLDKEKQIQLKLQKKLGGDIEVGTDYGDIDLLTDTQLIEIKKYTDWKCAIGQVIAYGADYPDREKIIYLFDVPVDNIVGKIRIICTELDIKVKKIDL